MEGVAEGQAWLLECLNATLNADSYIRKAAEDALGSASAQPGYGVALARVGVDKAVPLGIRQLAVVLLKQYVKQHWHEGEKYVPPTVSPEDKIVIRSILLQVLDDPHGKIRTAVGMAVASIASWDWPEEWPELMDFLLSYLRNQNDLNKVNGALKCLALFSGDLDDIHIPRLVPILFPSLYTIVSLPQAYEPSMRRRALIILHSCMSTLGIMSGAFQAETRALISPMLKSWMDQFAILLSQAVPSENPNDWSLRMEALKTLMQLVQNFPMLVFAEFHTVLSPLWQSFVSCLKVYEVACIQGSEDSFTGVGDSDGNELSLEAFAVQLIEFLMTIVGQPRYSKVLEKHLADLVYHLISYMQITTEQEALWSSDPNEFVSEENDVICSCRMSGVLLLEELVASFDIVGVQAITQAVEKRICDAAQWKAAGHSYWWKLREAAILAMGTISESLLEEQGTGKPAFNIQGFFDNILQEDLCPGGKEHPFLHGRSLSVASKFYSIIHPSRCEQFTCAVVGGLEPSMLAPIKIGACRALSQMLPQCGVHMLQPQMILVLLQLGKLLQEASDEILHLVLETLEVAIKADSASSAAIEAELSPLLLTIWMHNIGDPFVSLDAMEALEAIKDTPGCLEPLVSRVIPFVGPILANHANQVVGLLAGVMDLLTMLLKKSPPGVVKALFNVAFGATVGIIQQSHDHSEMQNATECLAAFVEGGGEQLLSWAGDPNRLMQMLLDSAGRLLNPELDSSSSLFVERFVTQLIQKYPLHMAQHVKELITALVRCMETANIVGLKNSLLLLFARLVHMSVPDVGKLLSLLAATPAKDHPNALAYVMSEWAKQQGEIQGAYQIKVTTTALTLILSSKHLELSTIYVQGHLLQSNSSGIVTRSRSKGVPERWSSISLAVKLLSLLVNVFMEVKEQAAAAVNEDEDDWVEDEGSEEGDAEPMPSSNTKSSRKSVFQPYEDISHLLTDEVQEGDYKEDPCAANDPINEINLVAYLVDFLKKLAMDDRHYFDSLYQGLPVKEKLVLQEVLAN